MTPTETTPRSLTLSPTHPITSLSRVHQAVPQPDIPDEADVVEVAHGLGFDATAVETDEEIVGCEGGRQKESAAEEPAPIGTDRQGTGKAPPIPEADIRSSRETFDRFTRR